MMDRVLIELFKTSDIEVIEECCVDIFHAELSSVQLQKRFQKSSSQL